MRAVLVLLMLCPGVAISQAAPPTYWIFFADKAASAEAVVPSVRAQERRALRGSGDVLNIDTPVSERYVSALAAEGVWVKTQSYWLNAVSAALTEAQQAQVAGLPFVREVRPVARLVPQRTLDASPAPLLPLAWETTNAANYGLSATQLGTINATTSLERGFNGAGVVLGFLDTEYGAFTHVAFARMLSEGRLLGQQLFTPVAQNNRHGQAVASIAVGYEEGRFVGPAWGAFVLAATTEYAPSETNQEEDAFVAGLEWLERNGADVVNTSLGYTTFDAGQRSYSPADLDGNTGVTTIAADRAVALGVVMVTSAGNEGCSQPANCWYYVGTPADGDSVIAVGAVTPDSVKAGFSSFGPTADGRIKPDVAAQGVGVYYASGNTSYAQGGGTSFSAPLVAGVVAQMLQANPALTPLDVRDILRRTASQAAAPDNRLGWGIINAARAVEEALVLDAEPALLPSALHVTVRPDPSNGPVRFTMQHGTGDFAVLHVYDVTGRLVAIPFAGTLSGHTDVDLSADLPAGLYLYHLTSGADRVSGTFLRLR